MVVEVCVNSFDSALNAYRAGASRIELCVELGVGGITPSHGLIEQVVNNVPIPVHVLIRPRSGDFTYSASEIKTMLNDIAYCKALNCAGVVFGVLTSDFKVDLKTLSVLVKASTGMHITFHRAIDWVKNPLEAIHEITEAGCHAILTSGQAKTAEQGLQKLLEFKTIASNKCVIMPGSGINTNNAKLFKEHGFKAIHFSAITQKASLQNMPNVSFISLDLLNETKLSVSDKDKIQSIVNAVK